MATLIKEKNYLVFTNDNGRIYKFNLADGIFYSTKGVPMKSTPAGFPRTIENSLDNLVIKYIYGLHCRGIRYTEFKPYANDLLICDKLMAIGYDENRYNARIPRKMLDFVNDNFKAFAKAYREDNTLTVRRFYEDYSKTQLFNQLGIKQDMYYTKNVLEKVYYLKDNFTMEQLKLIAYYLSRGVYMFFGDDGYYFNRMFSQFFQWCEMIEYTPTKDDFFKQYIRVKGTYLAEKDNLDNKGIVKHLAKHSKMWEFENEDFCIVVPQSVADFKEEADSQCNCVFRTYMPYVARGETNVVFVRKKSAPDVPYITCEVDNDGRIVQYLLKHNCRPQADTPEHKFAKEFGHFLQTNWNK